MLSSTAPTSRKNEASTGLPLIFAVERPSTVTLRSKSTPSCQEMPSCSSMAAALLCCPISNRALTDADFAPVRMSSLLVRSPSTRLMESMMMDFPAPVSPVSTVIPSSKSIEALSITAIFSI